MRKIMFFLFFLIFSAPAFASDEWGMHSMMYWFPWGGMLIMPILMVCLVILLIYFFRKPRIDTYYQPYKQEDALEILKKRYAKGEITREEFEDMKKDIS